MLPRGPNLFVSNYNDIRPMNPKAFSIKQLDEKLVLKQCT